MDPSKGTIDAIDTHRMLEPQLMNELDSRDYLGRIGRTMFYELAARGEITRVKLGRRSLFTRVSLDRYVERLSGGGAA